MVSTLKKKKKDENNAETKQVQHIGRKKKTQLLFKGIYSGRLAFVLCKYTIHRHIVI